MGFVSSVVACAGAPPPTETPETPSEAAVAETPAKAEAEAPATNSDADVTAIVQLVVDDPELDKYLHLGQKGRFPLQLAGEKLPSGLQVVKSTEPVVVIQGPKSKTDPVLVITDLEVQGDKASVRYRYDVEGIRGTVTLARSAQGWELKNSRIVER
ncbi:MAG: hypothetical protein K0R38_2561 [Polyangiaceae bacterium]|jgi:hypothetical protein|nr:hypothetical protein [Polyangiaceae bacterium]